MAIVRRRVVVLGPPSSGITSLAKSIENVQKAAAYDNEVCHLKPLTNYKNSEFHIDLEYFFAPSICGSIDLVGDMLSQAVGILVVYDLNSKKSFMHMQRLVEEIPTSYKREKVYILIGTKLDKIWMYGRHSFISEQLQLREAFVKNEMFDFVFDISAHQGMNLHQMMVGISKAFLKKFEPTRFEKHIFWRVWRRVMEKLRATIVDNY